MTDDRQVGLCSEETPDGRFTCALPPGHDGLHADADHVRADAHPPDERQVGLREAAYEAVAWSVIEVSPGAYRCRGCDADVTDVNAPHGDDCVFDALRAALALAKDPAPEGTRLVLMSEELMLTLGADRVEWGEPDQHGWFTPTLYRDSRLDAHAAQEPSCPICPHPAHRGWCEARPHGDPCSCRQSTTFAALPVQEERPDIDVEDPDAVG